MENKKRINNDEIIRSSNILELIVVKITSTTRIVLSCLILSLGFVSAFPIFRRILYYYDSRKLTILILLLFYVSFIVFNFVGILFLYNFQQLKKKGEAYYDELTNIMEIYFRNSTEEDYFENQHRIRLALKTFINSSNLPFVESKNSIFIYFILFFLLLILGTVVMFFF